MTYGGTKEKSMATHSSILPWRLPWPEGPGRPWATGSKADTTEATQH